MLGIFIQREMKNSKVFFENNKEDDCVRRDCHINEENGLNWYMCVGHDLQ